MTTDLERALRASAPRDEEPIDIAAIAADAGLLDVAYTVTDAPIGRLVLAHSDRGLVACSYDEEDVVLDRLARRVSSRVIRAPRHFDDVRRELDDYLAGERTTFTMPVDLRLASPFGQSVLEAAREVAYGHTATYSSIAAALGNPNASRAVGNALGANPVCIVVPCHRVVRAGGDLGGYAGGTDIKRRLLDLEAAAAAT
ncbi:MAG: methylated-DNA-[protein]-cysteine S-methyltransferase [Frankiales bacterium]|nr:methylated-DNA-[protein]-cysteine S-methyltransferase [Frankiales bacterium]